MIILERKDFLAREKDCWAGERVEEREGGKERGNQRSTLPKLYGQRENPKTRVGCPVNGSK